MNWLLRNWMSVAAFVCALMIGSAGGKVYGYWKGTMAQSLKCQNANLIAENNELRHDAQSFANKPKSLDDLVVGMCSRSIEQAKSDRTADGQLLRYCRERIRRK